MHEVEGMDWLVVEEPLSALADHARVPIAFLVDRRLVVTPVDGGTGGFTSLERPVDPSFVKDYDAIDGERPTEWARRWDLSHWGLIAAYQGGERVGGAVLAFRTAGLDMLEGRDDLAVLWDLRVEPGCRRRGVGRALFRAAEAWARVRGCRRLKVETQDVNIAASRFYAGMGCALAAADRSAYPDHPDEVRLIWSRDLHPIGSS